MTLTLQFRYRSRLGRLKSFFSRKANKALDNIAEAGIAAIEKSMAGSSGSPGDAPQIQTGRLAGSFQIVKSGAGSRRIISTSPYAIIQEFGGTINSPNMTIPLSAEAVAHKRAGGTARDFPTRLVFIIRGTKKFLIDPATRPSTFHYILVDSVYLPPRPFMANAIESNEFKKEGLDILDNAE